MENPYRTPKAVLGDPRITDNILGKATREAIEASPYNDDLSAAQIVERAAIMSAEAQLERA